MAYPPFRPDPNCNSGLWASSESEDNQPREIHPVDVVLFSPDEKHWHSATAAMAMTYIAIQE